MKKVILFLFIISFTTAQGQTLKELLYGGKLKQDSTGVIRSTDDLTTKIDTSRKIIAKEKSAAPTPGVTEKKDIKSTNAVNTTSIEVSPDPESKPVTVTPVKSNTKIWKELVDSLTVSLKTDVLSSKKVKKETYYFTVEYEINTDGTTNIINITASPENNFLLAHVKQWVESYPPKLTPYINSASQLQKIKKRHNFYITKD